MPHDANPITTLRTRHGMSRSDIARQLGVSVWSVGRYERGEAIPRRDALMKLAEMLGDDGPIQDLLRSGRANP